MPGPWRHLAARFFDVLTAPPLRPGETRTVVAWLAGTPRSADAFFEQPIADQRHGFEAAAYVASQAPERGDLIRAALLHDVGKRHSSLGPFGRSFASVALRFGLPLRSEWALYRDHGRLAAAELTDAGGLVADFARHHHSGRPASIHPADWQLLVDSDRARAPFGR